MIRSRPPRTPIALPTVTLLLAAAFAQAQGQRDERYDFTFMQNLPGRVTIEAENMIARDEGRRVLLEGRVVLRGRGLEVRAERAELDARDRRVVLIGSVRVVEGTSVLLCDRLELDTGTSDALLQSAVILRKEDVTPGALRRCVTSDGLRRAGFNSMTLAGDRITRHDECYRVEGAAFTSCDCGQQAPSWEIRALEADVLPGERAWLVAPVLYLKGVPVFILPVAYLPLSRRRTGFLFPQVNYSGRDGFVLSESFFVAIGPSVDTTMSVDWFEERGVRKRLEVRARPGARGGIEARVSHIDDDKFKARENRAAMHDRITAELDAWAFGANRTSLRAALRVYSDSDINRDFVSELTGRAADRAPSEVVADLRTDHLLWSADVLYQQDLRSGAVDLFDTGAHDTIQRLGATSLHLMPLRIVDGIPLELSAFAEVANFSSLAASWRDWGLDGTPDEQEPRYEVDGGDLIGRDEDPGKDNRAGGEDDGRIGDGELRRAVRLLVEPRLRLPLHPARFLWAEAGLAHRQMVYLPHGPPDVTEAGGRLASPESSTRGISFAHLRLGTELARSFGAGEDRVGHLIAPWLGVSGAWRGCASDGPRPWFDLHDRLLADALQLVAGADSALYRQRPGGVWERFLDMRLLQAVDLGRGRPGQATGRLSLAWRPFDAHLAAGLDWERMRLAELDAAVAFAARRGDRLRVSYLYLPAFTDAAGRPLPLSERAQREEGLPVGLVPAPWRAMGETVHVIEGRASAALAWGFGLSAGASLDLREEKLAWWGAGLHYDSDCRCWGFSISFRMLRGQELPDIFFLLDLGYLGSAGVGSNRKF